MQEILSSKGYYSGETYYDIGEHAPVAGIREAVERIKRSNADVIVAVGGGSPIDAAKAISYYRHQEQHGEDSAKNPLTHPDLFIPTIAVPTTLSVAETTKTPASSPKRVTRSVFPPRTSFPEPSSTTPSSPSTPLNDCGSQPASERSITPSSTSTDPTRILSFVPVPSLQFARSSPTYPSPRRSQRMLM